MNNYLITGGCGFIGSNLIEKLIEKECKIIVIDNLSTGNKSNLPDSKKITLIEKSVQDITNINIDKIDGIFHLAAQTSVQKSIKDFYYSCSNNLLSSIKIFDLAIRKNVPIVFASSSAIYGNLDIGDENNNEYDIISPYALDKLTLEHYAKMIYDIYHLPSIGLRFFNVYGPKQDPNSSYSGVITIFINNLLKNQPVIINGGNQTRDFIYVDNVVDVMIKSFKLLKKRKICDIFNVGTGKSITINKLLSSLVDIVNIDPKINRKKLPKGDSIKSIGNYEKIRKILDINISNFTNIDDGLIKTFNYYIKNSNK